MGVLKRVSGADYSNRFVGKFDFRNNIFRRRVGDSLERNYLRLERTRAQGYDRVILDNNQKYKIKINCFYTETTSTLFSVCDYVNRVVFQVQIQRAPTSATFRVWLCKETDFNTNTSSAYTHDVAIAVPVENKEYIIEVDIDFASLLASSLVFDGVARALTRSSNSVAEGRFTNGQTRTIGIGVEARTDRDTETATPEVGFSKPSFCQISTLDGNVLLHFDFLGDNKSEMLRDKAQLIQLVEGGVVGIESVPIPI